MFSMILDVGVRKYIVRSHTLSAHLLYSPLNLYSASKGTISIRSHFVKLNAAVRTDAELSEFEVTVGLHQGSVLSPLLFAAVMEVVSSEAESVCLPSCCMLMT